MDLGQGTNSSPAILPVPRNPAALRETPRRVYLWWELVAAQVPDGRRNLG